MKCFSSTILPVLLAFALGGCASPEFDKNTAKGVLEANPVQLNSEQLLLSAEQLTCGDKEDLWHLTSLGGGRTVGRLSDTGRALQFSDDVRLGDAGAGGTVQVTGKFTLRALQVPSLKDEGTRSKLVEARTVVVVNHKCFQETSPTLLGVRRGEFTAAANPMFRLRLRQEDWTVEELLH